MIYIYIYGKEEYIKTKLWNYKEAGLLASTLIIDSKQGGQQHISKEPNTLCLRDHLTKVWDAPFEFLGTQFTKTFVNRESKRDMLEQILRILHGISSSGFERASTATLELPSMKIKSKTKLADGFIAHFRGSTFAWRGKLVFTFVEQAKIYTPLSSL